MFRLRPSSVMQRLFVLLVLPAASLAVPATQNLIPIAAARLQPLGTVVTVEGAVTVPSGTFESATFDKGFAIQDATAGIYVSIATDLHLHLHKKVRVTGRVQDDGFGLLILKPDDVAGVVELPGARRVKAMGVATGELGESTEGRLVTVQGTVTQPIRDDRPFGFGVFIDDGSGEIQVFIHVTSGINPFRIPFIQEGKRIAVTGFSGQFEAFIEVSPRRRGDIKRAP